MVYNNLSHFWYFSSLHLIIISSNKMLHICKTYISSCLSQSLYFSLPSFCLLKTQTNVKLKMETVNIFALIQHLGMCARALKDICSQTTATTVQVEHTTVDWHV